MSLAAPSTSRPAGLATTLRAGLNAGLMNGMLFGLADGLVAGISTGTRGMFAWLGCLGLAVLTYGALWIAVMLSISLPLHSLLRAKDLYARFRFQLTLAFGLGLFIEL